MNREFLKERIESTKNMIIAYEDAILNLQDSSTQSYTLNTSQTTQTVTKFDINRLQTTLDSLYNRLTTLEARLTGGATINMGAAW